jgi:hypothetical protein
MDSIIGPSREHSPTHGFDDGGGGSHSRNISGNSQAPLLPPGVTSPPTPFVDASKHVWTSYGYAIESFERCACGGTSGEDHVVKLVVLLLHYCLLPLLCFFIVRERYILYGQQTLPISLSRDTFSTRILFYCFLS